jgi:hypothetical protein
VVTFAFFLICMLAAGSIKAATAFGANFALLVRRRNEMTFAFLGAGFVTAFCIQAFSALLASAFTFVWL